MSVSPAPNLNKLVKKWAHRVGVSDWNIKARYCKQGKLQYSTDSANVDFVLSHRRATILVLRPKDRPKGCQSIEQTLVHELLHLATAPLTMELERGSIAQIREEQIINRLAETLTQKPVGGV